MNEGYRYTGDTVTCPPWRKCEYLSGCALDIMNLIAHRKRTAKIPSVFEKWRYIHKDKTGGAVFGGKRSAPTPSSSSSEELSRPSQSGWRLGSSIKTGLALLISPSKGECNGTAFLLKRVESVWVQFRMRAKLFR
jgi:hypothetical protein